MRFVVDEKMFSPSAVNVVCMLFESGNVSAFPDIPSSNFIVMMNFVVASGYKQRLIPCVVVGGTYDHVDISTEANRSSFLFSLSTVRVVVLWFGSSSESLRSLASSQPLGLVSAWLSDYSCR